MDYTVHGILQARILEWVTFLFSRVSSQPRDQTQVSRTADRFFPAEPQGFFVSWAVKETIEQLHSSHMLAKIMLKILQARILEWVAVPFSRGSSHPRDSTQVSCIAGRFFSSSPALQADSLPAEPQGKPKNTGVGNLLFLQWIFLTQKSNSGKGWC